MIDNNPTYHDIRPTGGSMASGSTRKGNLAIKQPIFRKVDAEVIGGLARISQRTALIECELVLSYDMDGSRLKSGDVVMLAADSGLQAWAQKIYVQPDGTQFVLCPETSVIGFKSSDSK
jgi:hypothetical protein